MTRRSGGTGDGLVIHGRKRSDIGDRVELRLHPVGGAVIDAGADGEHDRYRCQAHHHGHGAAFVAAKALHVAPHMAPHLAPYLTDCVTEKAKDVCHLEAPKLLRDPSPQTIAKICRSLMHERRALSASFRFGLRFDF